MQHSFQRQESHWQLQTLTLGIQTAVGGIITSAVIHTSITNHLDEEMGPTVTWLSQLIHHKDTPDPSQGHV